jgi:hypothetical protein
VLSQEPAHEGAVESLEGAIRVVGHPRVLVVGQVLGLLLKKCCGRNGCYCGIAAAALNEGGGLVP